jgi:hypothetical protein
MAETEGAAGLLLKQETDLQCSGGAVTMDLVVASIRHWRTGVPMYAASGKVTVT